MLKEWWTKIDKPFFEEHLQKIKSEVQRKYVLKLFNCRQLLIKFFIFLSVSLICGLFFFLLRQRALDNFNTMEVKFNSGAAYSLGSNWSDASVYALKSISTIFFFLTFLLSTKWNVYLFSYILAINSLYNVIDKSIADNYLDGNIPKVEYQTVVDYIPFQALNFVCNIADMFITLSAVFLFISCLWYIIVELRKYRAKNEKNIPEQPSS